jgi:hypothetical protein
MPSAKNNTDPAVLSAFEVMIAGVPGVSRTGAAIPYTSINGNMYSSISRADVIGLRLGDDDRAEFLDRYGNGLFESLPGFFQKEYVAVPESLHDDKVALQDWFRRSHDYASGLKPKKTKR